MGGILDTLGPVFTSQEASAFLTQKFLDELGISGEDIEMLQTIDNASLQESMGALWASFSRDGVPSAAGIPEWKPYTPETGATMILDRESYLAFDHDRELLELLAPGYMYD